MRAVIDPAIRLREIYKSFGPQKAVEALDLTVPRESIYGLLGPNGAGKTTTIRIILDIIGPDSGVVEVLGSSVSDAVRARVGYLPEERGLYQKMKVLDHVVFLGILKGMRREDARREASRWLDRLELADRANDRVETLSKGMQQKVQFLSSVLHDPDLLILDEPFSGLDPINVDLLREIVLERKREGATVLFSTHLIEDAERLCERVCMIAGAEKVLDGRVKDIKASMGRREVALGLDGDASFLRDLPFIRRISDHGNFFEIRLAEGADPHELLGAALEAGTRIRHFELAEPSLREIFLDRAGGRRTDRADSGGGE
jgi:ABC-2 type transport system ATP-binding protein